MLVDRACWERGCACYDDRTDKDPVAVVKCEWVGLIRGVRVDGDNVIVSVKGGNEAARFLCGKLVAMIDAAPSAK